MNCNSKNLNWVRGEESARAWEVLPNSTVLLMDSEAQKFYIKSADSLGVTTLRAYAYHEATKAQTDASKKESEEYTTKEEHARVMAKIADIEAKINLVI